jgi:hypothetical protein
MDVTDAGVYELQGGQALVSWRGEAEASSLLGNPTVGTYHDHLLTVLRIKESSSRKIVSLFFEIHST